ncbi:NAD-dependent succinate-semialdehyde dehydrogenase [Ottowia thiooxydans]|uniref:NAD-dependent succinate-semialdehyde dehydrogenase n=1 Tax=Ottowia thiooxydans TaxID=219182 RepID=UPI00041A975B|nr:NAD-dependent succinate-semialdehyde dehydrogenase [Ottowia thiooxydans]
MKSKDLFSYPAPRQYVDGQWRVGGAGAVGVVTNPANDVVLAEIHGASRQDLNDALAGAERAFGGWSSTSAHQRGAVLRRAAQLLRERADSIALLMTLEQGKTLAESRMEVELSAETFEWYAAEGLRANGRVMPSRVRGARQMVLPQPLGPVAAFTPWNFPALLPARKIAPALAAGCTMVMKPAEETPASALALVEALADAGLPAGVLSMVLGVPRDISELLIASPIIRKITFTGSTGVGRALARLAAEAPKPCTLELGGHAPVLIFDDADLDRTVATCVQGKTRNTGQVCTSPTRFLVQRGIHDRFVAAYAQALDALKVGDGTDASSQMGPLANRRRLSAMEELVADAVSAGARVAAGGQRCADHGNFFRPTLLADVPSNARAMQVEPFGPLALVSTFETLEEGLTRANQSPYGLAAYAFTRSAETALTVAEGLHAGGIGINSFAVSHIEAPFGGLKDSGYGLEGGSEGLEAYMHQKYVHHA